MLAVIREHTKVTKSLQIPVGLEAQLSFLELDLTELDAGRCIKLKVSSILKEGVCLDAVIFNAAKHYGASVESMDFDRARKIMDVNFFSILNVIHHLIPILKSQNSGKLLAISSLSAHLGLSCDSIYSASKAALERLFESLDVELAPFGIGVGLIIPGAFRSKLMGATSNCSSEDDGALDEVLEAVLEFVSSGMVGFSTPGNQQAKRILKDLSGVDAKSRQRLARRWSVSQ